MKPKTKICKCGAEFEPIQKFNSTIKSNKCVKCLASSQRKKEWVKERKELNQTHKELKEKVRSTDLKTRKRAAKDACHEYIRFRDFLLPCISCGTIKAKEWHASHFHESGNNPGIRYDERNIHKSCEQCNTYKHGNLIGYRKGIIERYGQAYMDELDAIKLGEQSKKRWGADELRQIEARYKFKLIELKLK